MMKDGEQQKKMKMSTWNHKITNGNTKGVENKHWKNLVHQVRHDFFLFWGMAVEDVGYNVKGHQEIHKTHCEHQGLNI